MIMIMLMVQLLKLPGCTTDHF